MSALAEKLKSESAVDRDAYEKVRKLGQQRLMQYGFPTLKTEEWKYTSLRLIEKREIGDRQGQVSPLPEFPLEATVLHFDHGRLVTSPDGLPAGLSLNPMSPDAIASKDYDAIYGQQSAAFAWLNLARFQEAWKLTVSGEQKLILAITTSPEFNGEAFPRLHIELAPNASLELIEYHRDEGEGLVSVASEIELGQGGRMQHAIRRDNHESVWVQRTDVTVGRDADYRVVAFDQGGRLTRHDLTVRLEQSGAHGEIDGLVVIDGSKHVDWHTEIVHATGHTESRETFRMLADDNSVGVFNGRIHIYEDADDSHSDLNTANLLLSDSARVNIKPELEIYSEEVTASHGATIGQLDDKSVFYMQSRGLSESEAMALLKFGFAAEPLEQMGAEVMREWLLTELRAVL